MTNFNQLALDNKITKALTQKGYKQATPIQAKAIPEILAGKDIFGIAQTGTGKTAAFSLPLLHNLLKTAKARKAKSPRALILTPTRELATQIADNIKIYGGNLGLKYAAIVGGTNIQKQINQLAPGVDIAIATPGRLVDLFKRKAVIFDQVETLVLDEADRMLDMGFIGDIKRIVAASPEEKQILFFSATLPAEIENLANKILKNAVKIAVTPENSTVKKIKQTVHFVTKSNKPLLLKEIIEQAKNQHILVFTKTKYGAERVVTFLKNEGIKVAAIHGNKRQNAREKALQLFRDGKIKVLVATDIAARGIDISDISHVINFDIPHDPENYVHRIGRTARAGKDGIAISFCDGTELKLLKVVEKVIKQSITIDEVQPYHDFDIASRAENKKIKSNKKKFEGKKKLSSDKKPDNKKKAKPGKNKGEFRGKKADERRSKPKRARADHADLRKKSGGNFNHERKEGGNKNSRSNDDRKFSKSSRGDDRRSGSRELQNKKSGFKKREDNDSRPRRSDGRKSAKPARSGGGNSKIGKRKFFRKKSSNS